MSLCKGLFLLICGPIFFLSSCSLFSSEIDCRKYINQLPFLYKPKWSKHFNLYKLDEESSLLEILLEKKQSFKIILGKSNQNKNLSQCTDLRHLDLPVKKIVLTSSNQLPVLKHLDSIDKIIGVTRKAWFDDLPSSVHEMGEPLNRELVVQFKPELIAANIYSSKSFEKTTMIPFLEYLEENPLARVEWIVVWGYLLSKEKEAIKFFEETQKLLPQSKKAKTKSVLIGTPIGEFFEKSSNDGPYVYLLRLNGFFDVFGEHPDLGNRLSKEDLFLHGRKAAVCLIHENISTISQLLNKMPYIKKFECYKNNEIYTNAKKLREDGGNSFWDEALWFPHQLFSEYENIINKKSNQNLKWYLKL